MNTLSMYPAARPRRLRRDAATRALVRENRLAPEDLILPVFALDGQGREEDVASMPGVKRRSVFWTLIVSSIWSVNGPCVTPVRL